MPTSALILQCFALFTIAGNAVRIGEWNEKALAQIGVASQVEPNRTALELAFSNNPGYHFTDPISGQSYKMLGKGQYGAVFQCLYMWDGVLRHFAVKQIRDYKNAIHELVALQNLQGCPFVEQFVDSKRTAAYSYMVLWPMARGYDNQIDVGRLLSARNGGDDRWWDLVTSGKMKELKGLKPQELKFALAQIAIALHAMHANGISHNDIHVGNFLLHGVLSPNHAHVPQVLLTDFGRASLVSNSTDSVNNKFFSDWAFFGYSALVMCNGGGMNCALKYAFCTRASENVVIEACEKFRCGQDDLLSCPSTNLRDLVADWCFSGPSRPQAIDAASDFSNQFWSHPFWEGVDWHHLKVLGSSGSSTVLGSSSKLNGR